MMKIAITGSKGFIGSHLVRRLKEDLDLEVLEFSNSESKNNLFNSESLINLLKDAEIVVHLAGANKASKEKLLSTNILGTLKVLEALKKNAGKTKLIFASSFHVYEPINRLVKINEDAKLNPQSIYGISKKFGEDLIKFYAETRGLKSIILRFSNVYGPGCKPNYNSVIATLCYNAVRGEMLEISDRNASRDFIHVKDAVDAIVKCLKYEADKYEVFNVCSGKLVSLQDIIEILKKILEVKVRYGEEREQKYVLGDNSKIARLLNFKPVVEFESGLKETLENYQKENEICRNKRFKSS